MALQTLDAEAVRLLAGGQLSVLFVVAEQIEARVCGPEGEYVTGYRDGGWYCSCPERGAGRRCPHVAALQLVTVRQARRSADRWRAGGGRTA